MQIPRACQNLAGVAWVVSKLQAGLPMKMTDWRCEASETLVRTVRELSSRTHIPALPD
jgi:hypothetical protein